MDAAGVDRVVVYPPTWEGPRNDYALEAAAAHPGRIAVMGRADPADPDVVRALPRWRDQPGMLGLRLSVNRGDRAAQLRSAADSGFFAAAEEHQIPLSLYMPGSYNALGELAGRFQRLRIMVDHLGLDSPDVPLAKAVEPLLPLAAHPNIAVRASALTCFVSEPFPFPSMTAAVGIVVDAFGADRVFWGSDLSRLPCSYAELVDTFIDHLPALSDASLAQIMGAALADWVRWPVPDGSPP